MENLSKAGTGSPERESSAGRPAGSWEFHASRRRSGHFGAGGHVFPVPCRDYGNDMNFFNIQEDRTGLPSRVQTSGMLIA